MLVLTRNVGDSINIGDSVIVTVLSVDNGQVKMGIDAPTNVKIYRTEIYEQIQRQNMNATRIQKESVIKAAKLLTRK